MIVNSTLFSRLFTRRYSPRHILLVAIPLFLAAVFLYLQWNRTAPPAADIQTAPVPEVVHEVYRDVDGIFGPNQTITEVLLDQGLSVQMVHRIVDCARPVYNLAKVKAGYAYRLRLNGEGQFHDFEYPIDSDRYLTVYRDGESGQLVSEIKEFPFEIRVEEIAAVIDSSLFAAIGEIGENDRLAWSLEDIFSSDIDFFLDVRKGDSFKAVIEKKYLDGEFSKYGDILAAVFVNDGRRITGFLFEDKNGKPAYYDPQGNSLRKSFLKSPLKYTRISSRFSLARRHPITKKVQPHLGIDYAAPVGTQVRAVGNGRVTKAGRDGANGNMVQLRHPKGYETLYLHLSGITVKTGASVSQGQLIGYVGSTGVSTGPHLDFRIRRYGKAMNPLRMIFPPGDPVPAERRDQFAAIRDTWMGLLLTGQVDRGLGVNR